MEYMKNEYQVTWDVYRSWIKERRFKGAKGALVLYWCVIGILCIVFAIFSAQYILFGFLCLFCIYRAFFRSYLIGHRQYKQLASHYGKEEWTREILFGDQGITLRDESTVMEYTYSQIKEIEENGDPIHLVMNDNSVIRLYRSAFANGDWDQCKKEIQQRLPEGDSLRDDIPSPKEE